MVGKGILAVFESSNISETKKVTPTKIGVYAFDINPYMHEFFDPIPVGKGNLAVFESSSISETGEVLPTKISAHACYINPYLHEFFEPIPIN